MKLVFSGIWTFFCSNHDLRSWGWGLIQCHFSVNSFSLWKEKFAIRNCKIRRLLFAALPDIDLAKIILFCLFVFFPWGKGGDRSFAGKTDWYLVAIYIWGERLGKSLRAKDISQHALSCARSHSEHKSQFRARGKMRWRSHNWYWLTFPLFVFRYW